MGVRGIRPTARHNINPVGLVRGHNGNSMKTVSGNGTS